MDGKRVEAEAGTVVEVEDVEDAHERSSDLKCGENLTFQDRGASPEPFCGAKVDRM